jgi:probable Rubsico expression protein CbbX
VAVNDSGLGARVAFGASPAAGMVPAGDMATPPQDRPADEPLGGEDVVDLAAQRRRSGVDEVLRALDEELVGLAPVKARIRQIAALLLVDSARARFGLTTARPNLHMCFTGDPGTGKTTVALRMADLLKRLGYLERGHLVAVGREDLVGQYVGHTAPKTKEVLKRAMGGVLFIDEAYYLYRAENERDYGQESIEILLQVMENQRQDLVVILAGYKDRMDTFFQANPGMSSRIAHHIDFPGYTAGELEQIGMLMVTGAGYQLSPTACATFRDYLTRRRQQPRFANARSVRNAIERARLRHASRLFDSPVTQVSRDDLVRLEPEDFLASRVFQQPPEDVVHHA